MTEILVTSTSFESACREACELLTSKGYKIRANGTGKPMEGEVLRSALAGCAGVIAGLDHFSVDVIEGCPDLRVISRYGVGVDRVDLEAATEAGVVVACTPGANTDAVADLAFALMLACARRIVEADQLTRRGQWPKLYGRAVSGKTIGIVGVGSIGRAVARRAVGFDARVLLYDILPDEEFAQSIGAEFVELDMLIQSSDFVSIHVPLSDTTEGLIGARELSMMKPSAYLVNTARGGVVDEDALVRALRNGTIAGAGIDVYSEEPPIDNELLKMKNVVATPHMGSYTYEALANMGMMAVVNLIDVLEGRRPEHVANPEVYRYLLSQGGSECGQDSSRNSRI